MASTFALAPIPEWTFFDSFGQLLVGGTMETFSSLDHSQKKSVFQDPAGSFPYTNPFIFDGTGSGGPFYWEDDGTSNRYFIVIKDASGNVVFTIDDYPIDGAGGSAPVTQNIDISNHIINGQFRFFKVLVSPIPAGTTSIAEGGWVISKNNQTAADTLIFAQTVLADTSPTDNPPRILTYTNPGGSTGETQKDILNIIPDVKSFSNETVTVSFFQQGTFASPAEVMIRQNFGTGGSPTVETSAAFTFNVGSYVFVSKVIAIPTVAGKSRGTNDDQIEIGIRLPLNTLGTFEIANFQVERGNISSPSYIYETALETRYKILEELIDAKLFQVGDVRVSVDNATRTGWLLMADQTIGSAASGADDASADFEALFTVIWNSVANTWSPILDSGGAPSTRGASAAADFAANKRLTLPRMRGRVIGQVGTGVGLTGRSYGEFLGEETHTLTAAELAPHTHNYTIKSFTEAGAGSPGDGWQGETTAATNTGNGVSGNAHNNMQPSTFLNWFIKF